jgi:tetratricopeptide (TPR) repeat protein
VEADPKSVPAHLALANFYWATRNASETTRTLQEAYKLDPENPVVNQMSALFQIAIGKPADAEPYFKKLAEVSKESNAKLILADYYTASNRPQDALPLLQQLTSDRQTRSAAELRLADLEFRDGRRKEAETRIDKLLEREPNNASALIVKARFLSAQGQLDAAVERLQAAAAASPTSAEAHFALGRAYVAKNDRDSATKAFTETVRLNPRAVAAQLELSRLELAGGRLDSSIQFAEQAVKNAPQSADARLALVRSLIARRDVAGADRELQPLIKQFPKSSAVQTQAGILAAINGNRPGAVRSLDRALEIDQNNLEALGALISLDLGQNNPASAVSRIDAQLARTPNDADALLLAARTYAAANDVKKCEQALRKTIDLDAANFQAYGMLGRLYLSQKRLDEALKEFDELSKRQPRPVQAHTIAGVILEAQHKAKEARQRYEQALAIDPEMPVAANNLAWMLVESGGNLDVALQLAQTATRRLPDNPAVQDTLGWIYYKKGLAHLAIPPFQKSIEKDPKNPVYRFHLGLAYARVGDSAKARQSLQQALALENNFDGAAEARKVLASLAG